MNALDALEGGTPTLSINESLWSTDSHVRSPDAARQYTFALDDSTQSVVEHYSAESAAPHSAIEALESEREDIERQGFQPLLTLLQQSDVSMREGAAQGRRGDKDNKALPAAKHVLDEGSWQSGTLLSERTLSSEAEGGAGSPQRGARRRLTAEGSSNYARLNSWIEMVTPRSNGGRLLRSLLSGAVDGTRLASPLRRAHNAGIIP